jgi:hypothetical protein
MRDTALPVLDIRTGPAPALYAINDFYQGLRAFSAQANECQRLYTPPPRLRSIEDSRRMVSQVHNLSEFTGRPGPFAPNDGNFKGFDPPKARDGVPVRPIDSLINEWDCSEQEAHIQAHL